MTREFIVKICGITSPDNAAMVAQAGADWIGLNFWEPSARYLAPGQDRQVAQAIPSGVIRVGVFVNASVEEIESRIASCGLHRVQLHGEEDPAFRHSLSVPAFKAFRVRDEHDLNGISDHVSTESPLFLLDARHPSLPGGTGERVHVDLACAARDEGKMILAGGLRADNVQEAVRLVRPYGVDAASGVEEYPGHKIQKEVEKFIFEARKGNQ